MSGYAVSFPTRNIRALAIAPHPLHLANLARLGAIFLPTFDNGPRGTPYYAKRRRARPKNARDNGALYSVVVCSLTKPLSRGLPTTTAPCPRVGEHD